eukprot:1147595-Pelagomonas_calceolata.AAC.20
MKTHHFNLFGQDVHSRRGKCNDARLSHIRSPTAFQAEASGKTGPTSYQKDQRLPSLGLIPSPF